MRTTTGGRLIGLAATTVVLAIAPPAGAAALTTGSAVARAIAAPRGHSTPFTPTVTDPTTASAAALAVVAVDRAPHDSAAPRDSSEGEQISRDEVLARAQSWVDEGVPYSAGDYWTDDNGTYRQDCSGFVSMAWHLPSSSDNNYGETTRTLPDVATELDGYDQLQPGDMIDNESQHVVLFQGWADSDRTSLTVMELAHSGTDARTLTYHLSYFSDGGYTPYRYDDVTDG